MIEWNNLKRLEDCSQNVFKYIFTKTNAVAESVLYRYPTFKDRTVICCSTQSGCPVGCRFCGAGDHFVRSLNTAEIISQPQKLLEDVDQEFNTPSNTIKKLQIMFMSMGEPLLNLHNLEPALYKLYEMYPQAALLISTIGPFSDYDKVREFSKNIPTIGLQFSVHETTDERRNKLIPFKGKLKLAEIAKEGELWFETTGRQPFFNYCAHADNTSEDDVLRLKNLFHPAIWQATISVICERDEQVAAANFRQKELASNFQSLLNNAGYLTRMFDPAGQDTIGGGCGQLWFVQDWMKNNTDKVRKSVGYSLPVVHTPK